MNQPALFTVRVATETDAMLLTQLGATTFRETFADTNSPEDMAAYLRENFTSERLLEELRDPEATFLIAELSGKAAGYAKLRAGEPDTSVQGAKPVEIVRLYLLAASIGQGSSADGSVSAMGKASGASNRLAWRLGTQCAGAPVLFQMGI